VNGFTDINDLKFSESFLLRTPIFPYNHPHNNIGLLLNDTLFRYAIEQGSADLYRELEKAGFDYQKLSLNSKASLWRYTNRMHFRPTPFGLFAAFSVVTWARTSEPILMSGHLTFHIQHDFKESKVLMEESVIEEKRYTQAYIANPTLYPVQQAYRYLNQETKNTGTSRSFHIDEIESNDTLEKTLAFCGYARRYPSIVDWQSEHFGFSKEAADQYIFELIRIGVLVPDLSIQANITGEDFLRRNAMDGLKTDKIQEIGNYSNVKLYVNTQRSLKNNTLADCYQDKIKDGLYCLRQLSMPEAPTLMDDFIKSFSARYDRQQVPLLQALDPGIGVGYYSTTPGREKPSLLQSAVFENYDSNDVNHLWTPVHSLLLRKWVSNKDKHMPICLTEEDICSLNTSQQPLPNSLSVMFRITPQGILIEQAGGATGTSLSGRFTPLSNTIDQTMKALAKLEEQANPDVLFVEISHIEDLHTANIERRKQLYQYELPILCGSVTSADNRIMLSDLHISIINRQICLWSRRHGKRVIPRLSSAYNYSRSDLSVFRFLCDLQHQGIKSAFYFDLEYLFPNQDFYPRVCFKDSILKPATWVLDKARVNAIAGMAINDRIVCLSELADTMEWPRYLSLDEYDHQLVFDLKTPDDFYQLASQVKPDKPLVLREYLSIEDDGPLLSNCQGERFVNQFVATVYHEKTVYAPLIPSAQVTDVQRLFLPGSEWLYYKLYMHPAASNEILVSHILKCISQLRVQGLMKKWFFVRFKDPAYHLRIRLQLTPKHAGFALNKFSKILEKLAAAGIIQRYSLESYEREIERYSPELIAECEDFFCHGTVLIAGWFEKITADDADYNYYYIAVISIRMMITAFDFIVDHVICLFRHLYESMVLRLVSDRKGHNKIIKRKHREISNALNNLTDLHDQTLKQLKRPLKLFEQAISQIAMQTRNRPDQDKNQLFADLLHMHLNRLFVDSSQQQEMIFYYYFYRTLESEAARKKN